jgi:hypothetical protein
VQRILDNPGHTETQENGRIRYWGYIEEAAKWVRVVVDGDKVHNRFFDEGAMRRWGRPENETDNPL